MEQAEAQVIARQQAIEETENQIGIPSSRSLGPIACGSSLIEPPQIANNPRRPISYPAASRHNATRCD